MVDVLEYYSRCFVCEEIAGFLRGRWAGIEGRDRKWIRWASGKPLRVDKPSYIPYLVKRYRFLEPLHALYKNILFYMFFLFYCDFSFLDGYLVVFF